MSQSGWESDSSQRHFRAGRHAMRQLGRGVSRRTRGLLAGAQAEPEGGDAAYRRGPPVPSGIHRRSVSFDSGGAGLAAGSTWTSRHTDASGSSGRGAGVPGLPGLAHPLSTAIDSEEGPRTRESFSGAAHLDGSLQLSSASRSALQASDPFQNRHVWISEEDVARDAAAPRVAFEAAQIVRSQPVAAGAGRGLGSIARAFGNLSRRLTRMRAQRSASQPGTAAEERLSVLAAAQQHVIAMPGDAGAGFFRFVVNPADPVSDRESSAPDSPTISRRASSRREPLLAVAPPLPEFSSESLDRLCAHVANASGARLRRSRSDASVSEAVLAKLASAFVDNVRVSTRLAASVHTESSYGAFVRFHNSGDLSGIFATEAEPPQQTMEQGRASADDSVNKAAASAFAGEEPVAKAVVNAFAGEEPAAKEPAVKAAPSARYARNQDHIRQFVGEVRAARHDSVQRQREARSQRQIMDNSQAMLDAAVHVLQRQQRQSARADARRRATVLGMFCAPAGHGLDPGDLDLDLDPDPGRGTHVEEPLQTPEPTASAQRPSQLHRSRSFPHTGLASPPRPGPPASRWTPEDLHVPWHGRDVTRPSYPLQAPPTSPARVRRGFLAAMLGRLGGANTRRQSSSAPEAPAPATTAPLSTFAAAPPPAVALHVPAQSLADDIRAGIEHSAQDATLSSTGRRMYSEVLLSLSRADGSDSAPPDAHPPPRVAEDASRVASSSGSFADVLAAAEAEHSRRRFAAPELPGLEGYAAAPQPLLPFESPASEAGTGRTQILDFSEADVRSPAAALQRRPSARPEIRDVRGVLWGDTNPTSTAAASADLAAADLATTADLATADLPHHDPLLLQRLVTTSPDPRALIYDAASRFGSMRSHASPAAEPTPKRSPPSPAPKHGPPSPTLPANPIVAAAVCLAPTRSKDVCESTSPSIPCTGDMPHADAQSLLHRSSRQLAAVTDSDALAHASMQATIDDSPAVAAKSLPPPPATTGDARRLRPVSLQEYIEQQKLSPHSRASPTGHEQFNFRVSLLERRSPGPPVRKLRSVSLPSPHLCLLALPGDILQAAAAATHQRTRSFYDSPPLAQALLLPAAWQSPAMPLPQWPIHPPSHPRDQSVSEEEEEVLAERVLFSHLLGDGAALTSPELNVASLQPPPLFDPHTDTGENGVPESVLRAYMAGDLTAIERFFEHIMRITAPDSIYDGEASEDGDWTFGLEGPPPEIIAQREAAARIELPNASREVPEMADASAEASRFAASSANLHAIAPVASGEIVAVTRVASAAHSLNKELEGIAAVPSLPVNDCQAEVRAEDIVTCNKPAAIDCNDSSKLPVRKIAIAKSQLARSKRDGVPDSSCPSPSNSADMSAHIRKSSTTASLTNSQRPLDDESQPRAVIEPAGPWDDINIATTPNQTAPPNDVAANSLSNARLESERVPESPMPYDKNALCFSPGRARSYNRRQSDYGSRQPVPCQTPHDEKRQERQLLMTRLRVLETMIQKSAIEESRLQPPAVLRKSRLVEDIESIASIYSSSLELDYDRIYQELNSSQRRNSNSRHQSTNVEAGHLVSDDMGPAGLAAGKHRYMGMGYSPRGSATRGDVLVRLKQGAHARAPPPLCGGAMSRSYAAPAREPGNRPPASNSLLLNSMSDVSYSARSSGSIRIEIVDEGSAASLPATEVSNSPRRSLPYQSSARFKRTAKLLGS